MDFMSRSTDFFQKSKKTLLLISRYDKFSKYVNNKQDKKLVKEASEIELPDEMLG